jgi:hypothetical protein
MEALLAGRAGRPDLNRACRFFSPTETRACMRRTGFSREAAELARDL